MGNPAGAVKAVIIIFIIFVFGFFLFPGVHTEILTVDTTGWNKLAAGVVAILPYAFIGGVFIGIIWLWQKRGQ